MLESQQRGASVGSSAVGTEHSQQPRSGFSGSAETSSSQNYSSRCITLNTFGSIFWMLFSCCCSNKRVLQCRCSVGSGRASNSTDVTFA